MVLLLEALDVGRVHPHGCLEAKLQSCAAFELRRCGLLLRRLPQREGAHRRELLRTLRLKLSAKALQNGRVLLAVALEVASDVLHVRPAMASKLSTKVIQGSALRLLVLSEAREARVEINLEALKVGRVRFQGCLEATLQGGAALEEVLGSHRKS